MIEEKDIDAKKLYDRVNSLLNDSEEYKTIKNNLKKYKIISSSEIIYKEIKELVNNG